MNISDVIALLEQHENERGIKHWRYMKNTAGLKSYGIGLTVLRKLGKQIGRDHELALALWQSDIYDAKVIGLLIDEPKKLTREQVESQVEGVGMGLLTHVFSSCDATLPKAPFALELALEWLDSGHNLRRRSGFGVIYELSKKPRMKALTDELLLGVLDRIDREIDDEKGQICASMGGALMGIGKRNKVLNQRAIEIATRVGPIDFSDDDNSNCEPMDVLKHLTSDYIKQKLGID